jgi:uncharacterized phage-associated protein
MPYKATTIADWFLIRAASEGEALTQMKLQKLVYFAHGWNLGIHSEPLISDPIEAWRWGPVIKSLYRRYAECGSQGLPTPRGMRGDIDGKADALLNRIWDVYKRNSASELSAVTHKPGSPWAETYRDVKPLRIIPNELIERHYKGLAAKNG